MCIGCLRRNGARWTYERIFFIPCFQSYIIHQLKAGTRAILWLWRDNRRKALKSSFESVEPFAYLIRPNLVAELSDARINSDEYLFLNPHLTQIRRIVLSDDMPRCVIERAIRAIGTVKNCVYSSVQLIYDVESYVLKLVCFTSEAISIIYWDINALRPLAA
jgi:hypothetical protein